MSDESKSLIVVVLVCSFFSLFAFLAGIECQRRMDHWHEAQRAAYDRAAAEFDAQHPPRPVLLDGVWFCQPPSKWHAQRDGGSDAIVCVSNHFIPKGESN